MLDIGMFMFGLGMGATLILILWQWASNKERRTEENFETNISDSSSTEVDGFGFRDINWVPPAPQTETTSRRSKRIRNRKKPASKTARRTRRKPQ